MTACLICKMHNTDCTSQSAGSRAVNWNATKKKQVLCTPQSSSNTRGSKSRSNSKLEVDLVDTSILAAAPKILWRNWVSSCKPTVKTTVPASLQVGEGGRQLSRSERLITWLKAQEEMCSNNRRRVQKRDWDKANDAAELVMMCGINYQATRLIT